MNSFKARKYLEMFGRETLSGQIEPEEAQRKDL
jgi:hypothetical protein